MMEIDRKIFSGLNLTAPRNKWYGVGPIGHNGRDTVGRQPGVDAAQSMIHSLARVVRQTL